MAKMPPFLSTLRVFANFSRPPSVERLVQGYPPSARLAEARLFLLPWDAFTLRHYATPDGPYGPDVLQRKQKAGRGCDASRRLYFATEAKKSAS